jgi:hypothetical protein
LRIAPWQPSPPRAPALSLSSRSCLAAPRALLRPLLAGLEHELEVLSPVWSSSTRGAGGTEVVEVEVEELRLGFPAAAQAVPAPLGFDSPGVRGGRHLLPRRLPSPLTSASAPDPAADDSHLPWEGSISGGLVPLLPGRRRRGLLALLPRRSSPPSGGEAAAAVEEQ